MKVVESTSGSDAPEVIGVSIDTGASEITLTWQAVAGRSYFIECKSSLGDSDWTTVATGIPGVEPECDHTIPYLPGNAKAFYRVGVEN